MYKGVDLRVARIENIRFERLVIAPASAACVDAGGDTGRETRGVRIHCSRPTSVEKVAVYIHETRRDEITAHINDFFSGRRRDVRLSRGHAPISERYITVLVQILRRIDHLAAFEEQIVCVSHRDLPVSGHTSQRSYRGLAANKPRLPFLPERRRAFGAILRSPGHGLIAGFHIQYIF